MADNQVEEVKSKVDIVSLISEYIEVKKAGRNFKARCPFHGEKTPSFMISPEIQMYKCFGCGKSGDVFTFLEEHEGMTFSEAMKHLADKVGVKLISFKPEITSEKEKVIEINNHALNFYEYVLQKHPQGKRALNYLLEDRGLKMETIKLFKLGFSPDSSDALPKYLSEKKKYTPKDLETAGLIVRGRQRIFDRFGGRVIFPLFDHRGVPIGFAGRILPWDKRETGKYINSPETPAYHKSKVLYGLNQTKTEIREKKEAIVVEGELDMISSFQAGIKNVIAIKGSALTEDQIRLIGRFAQRIILCLDSDFAGDEAAKRGAILASNLGYEIKVCRLEGYKDPDEIARKDPEAFKKSLGESIGIWDFLIEMVVKKYGVGSGDAKAKISLEIIPLLATIEDKIVQAHYVELLARKLSVPVEAVNKQIESKRTNVISESQVREENHLEKPRKQLLEEKMIAVGITSDPQVVLSNKHLFSHQLSLKLIDYLEKFVQETKEVGLQQFQNYLPAELVQGFSEIILENSEEENSEKVLQELKILYLRHLMEELGVKIRESDNNNDEEKLLKLQTEFSEVAKKLSLLEENKFDGIM